MTNKENNPNESCTEKNKILKNIFNHGGKNLCYKNCKYWFKNYEQMKTYFMFKIRLKLLKSLYWTKNTRVSMKYNSGAFHRNRTNDNMFMWSHKRPWTPKAILMKNF